MSQYYTTIIVSDSRGRGLDDFIGNHPTPEDHQYVLEIKPGKSLSQLCPTIIHLIDSYNKDHTYCIVFAGICGMTDKTFDKTVSRKATILRYQDTYRQDKINNNIDTAKFLKNSYGDHINFCTVIPADLVAYFRHHNPNLPVPDYLVSEQKALEEDITIINKAFLDINSPAITNLNLSRRAQVRSKKKRQRSGSKTVYRRVTKFSYKELSDGVHFSPKLQATVFGLILDTSIRDIINILRTPDDCSTISDLSDTN